MALTGHLSLKIPEEFGLDPDDYRMRLSYKDIIYEPLSVEEKP